MKRTRYLEEQELYKKRLAEFQAKHTKQCRGTGAVQEAPKGVPGEVSQLLPNVWRFGIYLLL